MHRECSSCRWSAPIRRARRGDARDQNRLLTKVQRTGLACLRLEPEGPWFATPTTAVCPRHEFRFERFWGWALWVFLPWIVAARLRRLSKVSLDILGAAVDSGAAARCAAWSAWRGLTLARAASDVLKRHVPANARAFEPAEKPAPDEKGHLHITPPPEVLAHHALRTAVNAALMEARAAAWHPGLQDMVPSNIPSDLTVPAFGSLLVVRPEEE